MHRTNNEGDLNAAAVQTRLDWTHGYVDVRYHKHAQVDVERFDFERQGTFLGFRSVTEQIVEAAPEEASAWASESEQKAAAEKTTTHSVTKDLSDGVEITLGTAAEVTAFALDQGQVMAAEKVVHQHITEVRFIAGDNIVEWDVQHPVRIKGGLIGVKEGLAEPVGGSGEGDVRTRLLAKLQRFNLEKAYKLEKAKVDFELMSSEFDEMKLSFETRSKSDEAFADHMADLRDQLVQEEKNAQKAYADLESEKRNCVVKIQRSQVDRQELVTLRQLISASSAAREGTENHVQQLEFANQTLQGQLAALQGEHTLNLLKTDRMQVRLDVIDRHHAHFASLATATKLKSLSGAAKKRVKQNADSM